MARKYHAEGPVVIRVATGGANGFVATATYNGSLGVLAEADEASYKAAVQACEDLLATFFPSSAAGAVGATTQNLLTSPYFVLPGVQTYQVL